MSKIIIKNDSSNDDVMAMNYVRVVISGGMVSNGTYGMQYCFITTFGNPIHTAVSCDKRKSGTYTFRVSNYGL